MNLRLQHNGNVLNHCGTMIRMWLKVIYQSLTMVKPNQVIQLSAIDEKGLSSGAFLH